jgi:hypothetical protein
MTTELADTLLDSLAQTIDLARRCNGSLDADDLVYGVQTVFDTCFYAGQLTRPEWVELSTVCWDMHGYPALIQLHDV